MKNQKKKEKKKDDNVTIGTTPSHDSPDANTPNASAQDAVSTDSNYLYLSKNRKFALYPTTTRGRTDKKLTSTLVIRTF